MEREIKFLKAWFIYFLIATVCGMLLGGVAGAISGFLLGMLQITAVSSSTVGGGLGFVIGMLLSFYFYKWSIQKFIIPQVVGRVE